jgi:hypothetical protein
MEEFDPDDLFTSPNADESRIIEEIRKTPKRRVRHRSSKSAKLDDWIA